MGLTDALRNLDHKYPSSFLGLVVGIIIGMLGLYLTVFYEKKPELIFDVISNYRVYDIRENIGSLQINFEGENIKEKGQTLSLITLKILNPSRVDILKSFYDEKDPLGFEVISSRIIKCDVIAASNQYLHDTLKVTQVKENSLDISPIILESDQFFTLKMLVLHPENITPTVLPVGKVAGIKQIKVQEEASTGAKESKLNTAYSGDMLVQIIRIGIYGIGFVLSLIAIIIFTLSASEWVTTRKRKNHVKGFKNINARNFSEKEDLIFKTYINFGAFIIVKIERLLLNKKMLKIELETAARAGRAFRDITDMSMHPLFDSDYAVKFIVENNIASIVNGEVSCNQDIVDTVREFIIYLNAHIPDEIKDAKKNVALKRRSARSAKKMEGKPEEEPVPQEDNRATP